MSSGNSHDGRPVLLLLNGLPASGKSATARAWAARRPGTLVLDIDLVRTLVSGGDAASQARALAHAMAESHLLAGRDVVVPQLTARISNLAPFEEIATRTRAVLVHVLLDADPETLRRRITADDARHRDGLDDEQLAGYAARLRDVARTRDVTRIDTGRLTTDEVVTELEWIVPPTVRGPVTAAAATAVYDNAPLPNDSWAEEITADRATFDAETTDPWGDE